VPYPWPAMDEMDDTDELEPVAEQKPPLLGTVAIVGFPNVGKSTLVNRLSETRAAVVHATPGVTRDRKELICEWAGRRFLLVDTGGVDIADASPITRSIAVQAREAVDEADLVLFVVDARAGVTPGDEEVAQILRESHKPVLVLANKIDDPNQDALALELHRLGLGEPLAVSGLHGTGTGDLLDLVVGELEALAPDDRPELPEDAIRVAILGRPNVGKSSLVNALLGRERVIVSEIPGTTRDAIDTVLERNGRTFVLVDTAGLRRKRKHRQGIEYYSELRALEAADRADVALVLVDSSEGIVEGDLSVADVARKADCSTLVVLSKWDKTTMDVDETRGHLRRRLRQRPPFVAVSAQTGRGLERLLDGVVALFDRHTARIPTPELNRALADLREARQPPSGRHGKRLNLLYGAQIRVRPPRFRFHVNDPGLVTRDYAYWVENELREKFGLQGVPVSIDFVRRS
jgi:GTPase